jgi:hypothetical protein
MQSVQLDVQAKPSRSLRTRTVKKNVLDDSVASSASSASSASLSSAISQPEQQDADSIPTAKRGRGRPKKAVAASGLQPRDEQTPAEPSVTVDSSVDALPVVTEVVAETETVKADTISMSDAIMMDNSELVEPVVLIPVSDVISEADCITTAVAGQKRTSDTISTSELLVEQAADNQPSPPKKARLSDPVVDVQGANEVFADASLSMIEPANLTVNMSVAAHHALEREDNFTNALEVSVLEDGKVNKSTGDDRDEFYDAEADESILIEVMSPAPKRQRMSESPEQNKFYTPTKNDNKAVDDETLPEVSASPLLLFGSKPTSISSAAVLSSAPLMAIADAMPPSAIPMQLSEDQQAVEDEFIAADGMALDLEPTVESTAEGQKPSNLVSGPVRSFLDAHREQQALEKEAKDKDAKKPLQVKALKLAEEARKAEERRQKEREEKRAKLAQQLEQKKEEERKRRELDRTKREQLQKEEDDKRRKALEEKLKKADEKKKELQQMVRKKVEEVPAASTSSDAAAVAALTRPTPTVPSAPSASVVSTAPATTAPTSVSTSANGTAASQKSTLDSIKSAISSLLYSSTNTSTTAIPKQGLNTSVLNTSVTSSSFLPTFVPATKAVEADRKPALTIEKPRQESWDAWDAPVQPSMKMELSSSLLDDFAPASLPGSTRNSAVVTMSPAEQAPLTVSMLDSSTSSVSSISASSTYPLSSSSSMAAPAPVVTASSVSVAVPVSQPTLPKTFTIGQLNTSALNASTASVSSTMPPPPPRFVIPEENASSEDDDSEEDSEEEDKKKSEDPRVPTWARKDALHDSIKHQAVHGVDPDTIFGTMVQKSCDLEDIFGETKKRYKKRTSSANWARDHFTKLEEQEYKLAMGYRSSFQNSRP